MSNDDDLICILIFPLKAEARERTLSYADLYEEEISPRAEAWLELEAEEIWLADGDECCIPIGQEGRIETEGCFLKQMDEDGVEEERRILPSGRYRRNKNYLEII